MGLHLGANTFCSGHVTIRKEALRLMGMSYKLLGRVPLCDIARSMVGKKPEDLPIALAGQ